MEDWKSRVTQEKKELDLKLDKLTEFLKGPKPDEVSAEQIRLLNKQHQLMQDYSNVLAERLTTS